MAEQSYRTGNSWHSPGANSFRSNAEAEHLTSTSIYSGATAYASNDAAVSAALRDVKAVADAQARLVRVIEEVSQELTSRLAGHDRVLADLRSTINDFATGHSSLSEEFSRLKDEDSSRIAPMNAELIRLRNFDSEAAVRLSRLEEEMRRFLADGVETRQQQPETRFDELRNYVQQQLQQSHLPHQQKFHQLRLQLHQDLENHQKKLHQLHQEQSQAQKTMIEEATSAAQEKLQRQVDALAARREAITPANLGDVQQQLQESLLSQLSQQLSQQLQLQLQHQLEQTLQPQLTQQLQQQLQHYFEQYRSGVSQTGEEVGKQLQELRHFQNQMRQEISQRLQQQDEAVAQGKEALKLEAENREGHLSELQEAAQRLAKTAMQHSQQGAGDSASMGLNGLSASSSLAQRLALVEGEIAGLQRQEKERRRHRNQRMEEESLLGSQDLSYAFDQALASPEARSTTSSASPLRARSPKGKTSSEGGSLRRMCDELRIQVLTELGEVRRGATTLTSRVATCEIKLNELQSQVSQRPDGYVDPTRPSANAKEGLSSPKRNVGNSSVSPRPATPDWPFSPPPMALEEDKKTSPVPCEAAHRTSNSNDPPGSSFTTFFSSPEALSLTCSLSSTMGAGTKVPSDLRGTAPSSVPSGLPAAPPASSGSSAFFASGAAAPVEPVAASGLAHMRLQAQRWLAEEDYLQSPPPRTGYDGESMTNGLKTNSAASQGGVTPEGPQLPPWAEYERNSFGGNLVASPRSPPVEDRSMLQSSPVSYSFGAAGAPPQNLRTMPGEDLPSRSHGNSVFSEEVPVEPVAVGSSRFGVLPPPKGMAQTSMSVTHASTAEQLS
eukprot:TRINITY_DN10439_c0_g2_i1.p1 TRINITY_DN10439_c0_g2~~TRINITY_DN10439_c0_g2_i1.p1  ORF type:complete len:855 (+),score=173.10 TRINITY_DN10439_c0_g2_i1:54-2567(+)